MASAIKAAYEVFILEEDTKPADLIKIIDKCLKDVRRDKSIQAIKSLSLLTAMTQYVKLHAQYSIRHTARHPNSHASKQALLLHLGWARALTLHVKFDILSCIS